MPEAKTFKPGQFEKWQDFQLGKLCIRHNRIISRGQYGNMCGEKFLSAWCDGEVSDEVYNEFKNIK